MGGKNLLIMSEMMLQIRVGISQQDRIGHKPLDGLVKLVTEESLGESNIHFRLAMYSMGYMGALGSFNGNQVASSYLYVSSQALVSHFTGTSAQVQSCSKIGAKPSCMFLACFKFLT